jgi:putative hydrolase of the HAD superfamily
VFRRDGVLDLIAGAVYSSEIDWTKPHTGAFRAAMGSGRCVEPGKQRVRR